MCYQAEVPRCLLPSLMTTKAHLWCHRCLLLTLSLERVSVLQTMLCSLQLHRASFNECHRNKAWILVRARSHEINGFPLSIQPPVFKWRDWFLFRCSSLGKELHQDWSTVRRKTAEETIARDMYTTKAPSTSSGGAEGGHKSLHWFPSFPVQKSGLKTDVLKALRGNKVNNVPLHSVFW